MIGVIPPSLPLIKSLHLAVRIFNSDPYSSPKPNNKLIRAALLHRPNGKTLQLGSVHSFMSTLLSSRRGTRGKSASCGWVQPIFHIGESILSLFVDTYDWDRFERACLPLSPSPPPFLFLRPKPSHPLAHQGGATYIAKDIQIRSFQTIAISLVSRNSKF